MQVETSSPGQIPSIHRVIRECQLLEGLAGNLDWAVVPPMQGSKATHPVENKVAMLLSYVGSLVGQPLCPQGEAQETNSNGMWSAAEITLSQG